MMSVAPSPVAIETQIEIRDAISGVGFLKTKMSIMITTEMAIIEISETSFIADVDFDENFNSIEDFAIDSDDNICDLNRYCIISDQSFSAANYFAFQARASKRVKLFGSKSSGGNCFVMEVCTPAGTVFSTSSFMEVFSLHNGGFVGVEDGVAPDISFPITEFDKVYDRNKFYNKYLKDQ